MVRRVAEVNKRFGLCYTVIYLHKVVYSQPPLTHSVIRSLHRFLTQGYPDRMAVHPDTWLFFLTCQPIAVALGPITPPSRYRRAHGTHVTRAKRLLNAASERQAPSERAASEGVAEGA